MGVTVPWRPTLPQVAAYVPRRTIVGTSGGYGEATATFTAATRPAAAVVELLIDDACTWVMTVTGDLDPSLGDAAAATAAQRAAAMVELGYPDDRDDVGVAEQLLRQSEAARADLDRANLALTGADVTDPAETVRFSWSFPPPAPWGDNLR